MASNKFNARSSEIDEILGKAPNRILRWGISIIFIVIVILLIGSWIFRYPDFISSSIIITSYNPPADLLSKSTGRLDSIFVYNKETVKDKQILAVIGNPAHFRDVSILIGELDSLNTAIKNRGSTTDNLRPFLPQVMRLGELEVNFSEFISAYNDFVNYLQTKYYVNSIVAINEQIRSYKIYQHYIDLQKQTEEQDLELSEKDYNRYQKLFRSGSVSESDLDGAKSRYLNKKFSLENMQTSLANSEIQISQLESNIIDLRQQDRQQKDKLLLSLNSTYNNLRAGIDIWEKQYVIKAPEPGECVFTEYWDKNQNVTAGEKIFTIVPEKESNMLGKLLLPVEGAGKVRIGQNVNIKLSNYPYMEFGMLRGKISNISPIPNDNNYYVEITFLDGMKTTYGKILPFSQKMLGTAEIITNNRRLFSRIMQPLKSILHEKSVH